MDYQYTKAQKSKLMAVLSNVFDWKPSMDRIYDFIEECAALGFNSCLVAATEDQVEMLKSDGYAIKSYVNGIVEVSW